MGTSQQDEVGRPGAGADTDPAIMHADRLLRITAAIAEAVGKDQVHEAVVDRVAAALDASSAGLWIVSEDGERLDFVRAVGYADDARAAVACLPLGTPGAWPAVDCALGAAPRFIPSGRLVASYPHLAAVASGRAYAIACLPLLQFGGDETSARRVSGVLAFTFEKEQPASTDEAFLVLVARYATQALERLRLLREERIARTRIEQLHALAAAVIRAENVGQVFDAALSIVERSLGTTRSSILVSDPKGAMRLKAWSGLGEACRAALEGHSPWARGGAPRATAPLPIVVVDAERDPETSAFRAALAAEGIRALAFIPLVSGDELIGGFTVYYDAPRELTAAELAHAEGIAHHLSAAIVRFRAIEDLERTVQFNEVFTGMLGHDLRNPLAGILAAAQLAEMRAKGEEAVTKPLGRILAGGRRMSRMIDQLLDFTRVRTGEGLSVTRAPMDIVAAARKVIAELGVEARLVVRSTPGRDDTSGIVVGSWDGDRIAQLLTSLVGNAARHAAPAPSQPPREVTVRVDDTDAAGVRVTVHNAGVIPPAVLPALFEPLAVRGAKQDRQGLGLGLYISREIAVAHGGALDVTSNEAHGTTFTVMLPREAPFAG